jgi:hypothetical protein
MNPNAESAKSAYDFHCETCDFKCFKKSDLIRHFGTRKHKILINPNADEQKSAEKIYVCECGKKYKHMSSLCGHKKKCNQIICIENMDSQLILKILQQNDDFKQLLVDQNKMLFEQQNKILEISKTNQINTINNNTNNNNSHNKTFNLQVFLNETCKDAMNIMDFVDSLQIQLSDLENVGRNGFVAGISDIILKNLRALDITQRPIHCSDQKREIVYIKDDNQWHKEHPENEKLKKAIKYIAHKNTCLIKEWKAKYPDCGQSASRKSDLYNKIVYEAMSLDNANAEKIIKRIAKEIGIDSTFKKK